MCSLCIASAQGATAPAALRVADCPAGNAYKVSVTGLAFCIIWHDRHSADWLAALASPYPASPDCPLFRGQNKTPRNILFISISTVSTGCCAPSKRGKGGGASHQRGNVFPRPPGRLYGFPTGESPVVKVFKTGAFYNLKAPYLASAAILYTFRGRSPQPVREASAGPGQNPWRPGPKARRRHQPSPAKAGVNLREYWKALPRPRPRHRRPHGRVHHIKKPAHFVSVF